jgi:hypothetical protein
MADNKTSISNASSYSEIGEFWDTHDLSDYWDSTHEVEFQVNLGRAAVYFPVDRELAEKLRTAARDRGVSPDALLNVWLKEHVS